MRHSDPPHFSEPVIIVIQSLLILVGSTALGAVLVGFGFGFFVSLFFIGQGPEDYTGEVYSLGSLLCGGFFGAIVAFYVANGAISNQENKLWKSPVWISSSLGLVAGYFICQWLIVPSALPLRWVASMIFSFASSFASGLIAHFMTQSSTK